MLANTQTNSVQVGALAPGVHKPATFRKELISFISAQLPIWRDRPERRKESSETILTSQLCAHLNSAARLSPGWDILQFRVEEADEQRRGRKMDLVAAPVATAITIEGRTHTDFDPIMPIECKRLPTPQGSDRDEREYVFSNHGSVGGIQRFKAGLHGAAHNLAAMIGYVQEDTAAAWLAKVGGWIEGLVGNEPGWAKDDQISMVASGSANSVAVLQSSHQRVNGLPVIEIQHLWLEMAGAG